MGALTKCTRSPSASSMPMRNIKPSGIINATLAMQNQASVQRSGSLIPNPCPELQSSEMQQTPAKEPVKATPLCRS